MRYFVIGSKDPTAPVDKPTKYMLHGTFKTNSQDEVSQLIIRLSFSNARIFKALEVSKEEFERLTGGQSREQNAVDCRR